MANRPILLRPMKEVIESVTKNRAQRDAIKSIGFSGLLGLKCTQFPRDLRNWLVDNFKPESRELNIHGTTIIVTHEDVEKIFGLPSSGRPVPIAGKTAKEIKGLFGAGKITTKKLKQNLLKMTSNGNDFVVKFVLFMIGSLLCATSGFGINRHYLHALTNISAIGDMNWSKHVLDFLCEGVKKSKAKPNKAPNGCTLFLVIFYLDHMTPSSIAGPKVGAWGDKTIISKWESLKTLKFDKKNEAGFHFAPSVSHPGTTKVTSPVAKPKQSRVDKKSFTKERGAVDKSTNHFQVWSPRTMERAKEVQSNLSPEHSSFIKVMQKSNVSPPFHMCLPSKLSLMNLPRRDRIVVFEVESGKKYRIKLLGVKWAFSGGWSEFSIAEKLLENDALVFHLVTPFKFKVYIVRANASAMVDKTLTVNEANDNVTEKGLEENKTRKSYTKRPRLVQENIC